MAGIVRFGVSMERELLRRFDARSRRQGHHNRSEAVRELVRNLLVEEQWASAGEVAGTILLVFDHHRRQLPARILAVQHTLHEVIVSTQHIHCDRHNCLEVIVFRGPAARVRRLFFRLKSLKGIKYAALARATTGRQIA